MIAPGGKRVLGASRHFTKPRKAPDLPKLYFYFKGLPFGGFSIIFGGGFSTFGGRFFVQIMKLDLAS